MLEEYSVRSSDATIDIVYSEFSGSVRDSELIINNSKLLCNNETTNNNEINNVMSKTFYKKKYILCAIFLFTIVAIYVVFIF